MEEELKQYNFCWNNKNKLPSATSDIRRTLNEMPKPTLKTFI
jgi:hypothetical protein